MIELRNLTKRYRGAVAVDGVSARLSNGRVYGIVGPRGAGKSTLLSLLAGTVRSTAGVVRLNGFDLWGEPKRARALIGYLPEGAPLGGDLSVESYLQFVAEVYGVDYDRAVRRIHDAEELTGLLSFSSRRCDRLTRAQRVRVLLAGMLVSGAEILILDSPTVGLSVQDRDAVVALIGHISEGRTVFLATRDATLVESLADGILWMEAGKLTEAIEARDLSQDLLERLRSLPEEAACASGLGSDDGEFDGEYEIIDEKKGGRS